MFTKTTNSFCYLSSLESFNLCEASESTFNLRTVVFGVCHLFSTSETPEQTYQKAKSHTSNQYGKRWWQEEEAQDIPNSHQNQHLQKAIEAEALLLPSLHQEKEIVTSDREELIQYIKRGQRPTWLPKPGLEALCAEANKQAIVKEANKESKEELQPTDLQIESRHGERPTNSDNRHHSQDKDPIERPPSALHAGDFRDRRSGSPGRTKSLITAAEQLQHQFGGTPYTSSSPWYNSSPPRFLSRSISNSGGLQNNISETPRRTRAPSLGSSLSSSFVMRIPTSPLVHAMSNTSLELLPHVSGTGEHIAVEKGIRRRTMPPNTFEGLKMSPIEMTTPNFSRPLPQPIQRSDPTQPYQTHATRRSLSSVTYQPASSPRSLFTPRSKRPSFGSDVSPGQHASMVGSFEESILRGRMSTAPSKPLDFVAQIGVLGKDDTPSPYVGTVDLEHNLKPVEQSTKRRRQSSIDAELDPDIFIAQITGPENTAIGRALANDTRERKRKTSKVFLGGAYRVPQQGQLQIVIKNPNKTAVKLFLVPYDLDGMQPGTKTFIRQRSYSSGPILENIRSDSPAATVLHDPLMDKHILRYLIHLKFCCPAKGRFYLYDNVRVVFANRIPDGKEKLRIEVQLPEPRFSPYKPANSRRSSVSEMLAFHKISDVNISPSSTMDGIIPSRSHELEDLAFRSPPIPFALASRPQRERGSEIEPILSSGNGPMKELGDSGDDGGRGCGGTTSDDTGTGVTSQMRSQSPVAGFRLASTSTRSSPIPWSPDHGPPSTRSFSPAPPETAGNGLLSMKFRQLNGLQQPGGKD